VIAWTGRKMVEGLEFAAAVLDLGLRSFREFFLPARRGRGEVFRVIASQILFTGVDALESMGISLDYRAELNTLTTKP